MPKTSNMTDEEAALDAALCNFCNNVGDPYEPVSRWEDGVERSFYVLRDAYNEWYKTKVSSA